MIETRGTKSNEQVAHVATFGYISKHNPNERDSVQGISAHTEYV